MDTRLGKKGRDKITGFEGIITTVAEHLYGCKQIALTPPAKENVTQDICWFDEDRVEIVETNARLKDTDEQVKELLTLAYLLTCPPISETNQ